MDGLVSTGIKNPYTILKIIFANEKNFFMIFINILKCRVENSKVSISFSTLRREIKMQMR